MTQIDQLDIKAWITCNFLLLKSDKFRSYCTWPLRNLRNMVSNQIFMLVSITLASVRNLIFDHDMLDKCVGLCSVSIAKIRNILSQSDAAKPVLTFVTSRLYYCNYLLSGGSQ